jgi:phosphohistidine phosphatase
MRVYLLRHGPAGSRDPSRWPDDAARPLSPRGRERTEEAVRGLARLEPAPTVILTSPLVRAEQTAKLLRQAYDGRKVSLESLDALAPGGSYRAVLQRLVSLGTNDAVFLVGHEPDLGKLAGVLSFGAPASSLPLKKAGAVAVAFDGEVRAGAGRLRWFLPPRILRRLARKGVKV